MSRTNVDLNDQLVDQALNLSHLRTKKEVLHLALQELVKKLKRKGIVNYMGSGVWQGDLDQLRKARV